MANKTEVVSSPEDLIQSSIDELEGFVEEQVGFPPYWNPAKKRDDGSEDPSVRSVKLAGQTVEYQGNIFIGTVLGRDDRDPDFTRYHIESSMPALECRQGPADDAEKVIVKRGEQFTCSAYASLPLYEFMGMEVVVVALKKRKLPGNEESGGVKRDLWTFKVLVSANNKEKLKQNRLKAAERQSKELQEANERF